MDQQLRINRETQDHLTLLSKEITSLIINNVRDIITITNPEGKVEYISPAVYTLLGHQPNDIIGKNVSEYYHPDDLKERRHKSSQSVDENLFRCRVKNTSGHFIWFETTLELIYDVKGNLSKMVGVGREISDRIQVENDMRETKEQFESVILNNADAIWITDINDIVKEVNPAFETMFGWDAKEVIGQKLPIIPKFLRNSMEQYHQQIRNGGSLIGLETIRQRKNGSFVEVEATLSPFQNSSGKIIGITGICRDISRRKKTEEELKAKTTLLESFIDYNGDAIILSNKQGVVQKVNKTFEKMFGWSKGDVLGKKYLSIPIIPSELTEEVERLDVQVKNGEKIIGYETVRKHKNGNLLNVVLTASPIFNGRSEWDGYALTIRDITDWKAAQKHLQNSEKLSLAGQLAAGIAHEIRNPMTSIKGFMTLMKPNFDDKKQYYDIITSEIERIESILNELLFLAKPQMVSRESQDIRELINQVITLLESQAILQNVQFVTDFKVDVPYVYCDRNQLKQVFINFIKNSLEAMPNGGKITIELRNKTNEILLIKFGDQGCGIPKDILDKIGQPFYTTKEKGTGLGFMVSKQIIENHSGNIHIESALNKGTLIEITIPTKNP